MRLRAEYFFLRQEYDRIHFNFTNGMKVEYSRWIQGDRIVLDGNKGSWQRKAEPSTSYTSFWKYMEIIFAYAGTTSLENEMKSVPIEEMEIGDVSFKADSPDTL